MNLRAITIRCGPLIWRKFLVCKNKQYPIEVCQNKWNDEAGWKKKNKMPKQMQQ